MISGVAAPKAGAPSVPSIAAILAPKQLAAEGLASAGLIASAMRQLAKAPYCVPKRRLSRVSSFSLAKYPPTS